MKKKEKKHTQTDVRGVGNFSCRHPKLWSYIKSNVKAFFITGAITFVVSASATTVKILHSRQVRYKNDKSVDQAITELYQKAERCYDEDGIPLTYTKLEYLESTGTQYIDTGIISNSHISVMLEVGNNSNVQNDSDGYIFGYDEGLGARFPSSGGIRIGYDYGNWITYDRMVLDKNTFYLSSSIFTFNDFSVQRTSSGNSYGKIGVFCTMFRNQARYLGKIKLYYLQIYDNDTLVRDYIPVLDSNDIPCLYDKVSKTCFYNQGTGEFLYG